MSAHAKPAGEAVTRHPPAKPRKGWTDLPVEGRTDPIPALPPCPWDEGWHESSAEWWNRLWSSPQATQWRIDDPELSCVRCQRFDASAASGRLPLVPADLGASLRLSQKLASCARRLNPGNLFLSLQLRVLASILITRNQIL